MQDARTPLPLRLRHQEGEGAVRATTLLRKLIGIQGVRVVGVSIHAGSIWARVEPAWRRPRCSGCGERRAGRAVATERRSWRHLDLCGVQLHLVYDVRRVYCPACGTVVEAVPWATHPRARFSDEFDELVAFLAQHSDKTTVQRLMRIAWRSVGRCIQRVVERLRPDEPLAGLTAIGVDEVSYRKHHHYLTLITNHATRRVAWGKEGRNAKTLAAFFDELGPDGRAAIEFVTADLSGAYMKAIREAVPHATLIFDRFHVQQLVGTAVDETRREEWRRMRGTPDAPTVKKSRWALLKNPVNLTEAERAKLAAIQGENKRLYRAYLLKEQFRDILDRRQHNVVRRLLRRWLGWATRSRLPAFVKVARTIRQHLDGIVEYVRWRYTNSPHEGQNNKVRLVTRRAYGFHSAEATLAMIELCCSGLDVPLPHRAAAA